MSTRDDCKPTLRENLRRADRLNLLCIALMFASLALLAGACAVLYHLPQ